MDTSEPDGFRHKKAQDLDVGLSLRRQRHKVERRNRREGIYRNKLSGNKRKLH